LWSNLKLPLTKQDTTPFRDSRSDGESYFFRTIGGWFFSKNTLTVPKDTQGKSQDNNYILPNPLLHLSSLVAQVSYGLLMTRVIRSCFLSRFHPECLLFLVFPNSWSFSKFNLRNTYT
jgi:hypothetical protein